MKGRLLGPTMTQYCCTSSKTGAGSWRWSKTGKAIGALYGRVMKLRNTQLGSKNQAETRFGFVSSGVTCLMMEPSCLDVVQVWVQPSHRW